MPYERAVIVGSSADVHVRAVTKALDEVGKPATIFDAESLESDCPSWNGESWTTPTQRGWIRRLSPPDWRARDTAGSHDAAVRGAWVARLTGEILTTPCTWLTPLPALIAAENKMNQLALAGQLAIRTPKTLVSNDLETVKALGLERVLVKPLGVAAFTDAAGDKQVFQAQLVDLDGLSPEDVAAAPFIFQELVPAVAHLRVVTVAHQSWVARLDATGLPVDWRFNASAHNSFQPVESRYQEVRAMALALAQG